MLKLSSLSRCVSRLSSGCLASSINRASRSISDFVSFKLSDGHLLSHSDDEFNMDLYGWKDNTFKSSDYSKIDDRSTSFGFVQRGKCKLYNESTDSSFELDEGSYFSFPNTSKYIIEPIIENNNDSTNCGIINVQNNYNGIFSVGGPIEKSGRLRYIDGTTTNLLLPPIIYGDPCLNLLYLANGLEQTAHTHPSFRSGFVVDGNGVCLLKDGKQAELSKDTVFFIPKDGLHAFKTDDYSQLNILTFHPDSEFGPEHQEHPMMKNTIINGMSAVDITQIHTKKEEEESSFAH